MEEADWNDEYRSGHWDYLDGASERGHYMLVLGYIVGHRNAPAVLDVGCGNGVLFDLLQRFSLAAYHGIDISDEAISRARFRAAASRPAVRPDLRTGDFESFEPRRRYDVIVFNESLSYAVDPLTVLRRFAGWLEPDGILIVSLCYNSWQAPMWGRIEKGFSTLHASEVTNEDGMTWLVRVVVPRSVAERGDRAPQSRLPGFRKKWADGNSERRIPVTTNILAALSVLGTLIRLRR